ncbi:MAG: hypothetical protein EA411_05410 [Saprospirales bacterium]|nr:MAG: hypothetical protein EA411_05410 [Saprospirales bacterium]
MFRKKWDKIWGSIPLPLRNKYILVVLVFGIWMIFFDKQSVIKHYKLQKQLSNMHNEMDYYREEIDRIEMERAEMEEDIERYVRERYFMSKENEDVFVIKRK